MGMIRVRNRRDRKVHGMGYEGGKARRRGWRYGRGMGWRRDVDDDGTLENG